MAGISEEFLPGLSPRNEFLGFHNPSPPRLPAPLVPVDRDSVPDSRACCRNNFRRPYFSGASLSPSCVGRAAAPGRRTDSDINRHLLVAQDQERTRRGLAWAQVLFIAAR